MTLDEAIAAVAEADAERIAASDALDAASERVQSAILKLEQAQAALLASAGENVEAKKAATQQEKSA